MRNNKWTFTRGWEALVPVFILLTCWLGTGCSSSPYNSFNRGVNLLQKGNRFEAETILLETVQQDMDNAEAWNQLGIIAFENGNLKLAEKRFRKAYELNNLHPAYPRNLAYVYAERKKYDIANNLLQRSLALEPDNPDTLVAIAKLALLQKHQKPAHEALKKALKIDPAHQEAITLFNRIEETTALMNPEHNSSETKTPPPETHEKDEAL